MVFGLTIDSGFGGGLACLGEIGYLCPFGSFGGARSKKGRCKKKKGRSRK